MHRAFTAMRCEIMANYLPRAGLVLIGWGGTCALLDTASPATYSLAGITWAMLATMLFSYRKSRPAAIEPSTASDPSALA
jgi:hypothetical protein